MIDLHLHLDGSLTREELVLLAKMSGIPLEYAKTAHISVDESCHSLNDYLKCFEFPLKVLQKEECIEKAVYFLLSRLSRSGLLYAEVRFAPQLHTQEGLTQKDVVEAAIKGLEKAKKDYAFPANLILCAMRGEGNEEENLLTVRLAKEYLHKGVCGLDLAGAEALFPTSSFQNVFKLANELDIPFTIHAGEASGPDSIWEALRMGARRIGHGVSAVKDKMLLSFLASSGVLLELCPTSEKDTHAIDRYEDLPLKTFLRYGVKTCINTDDMTVSNITLQEECEKVQKTFGLSDETMKELFLNSVEGSFLENDQKDFLKEELEKKYR